MESVTVEMPKEPPSQLPETTDMETTTKEESQRKEIEELRRTIEEKRRLLVSPTYLFYWVWPVTFVGYMFVVSYRKTVALRDTLRGEPLRSVIDSAVFVDFPRTEPVEQGVRVTVPVNVRVLGLDAEGMMQGLSGAARAETELPAECGAVCRASAALRPEGSASPSGDGAELRAALTLDAGFFAQQTLRTLSAGTIDPPAEPEARRPSLVIRAGLDGGPVWDVAKQYGTSVAAICAANGLSGEEIEAGGMLLIPM